MARHLGDLRWEEVRTLQTSLIEWLKDHDVAGSVAEYSLYRAIQKEWEWAVIARNQRAQDNSDDDVFRCDLYPNQWLDVCVGACGEKALDIVMCAERGEGDAQTMIFSLDPRDVPRFIQKGETLRDDRRGDA